MFTRLLETLQWQTWNQSQISFLTSKIRQKNVLVQEFTDGQYSKRKNGDIYKFMNKFCKRYEAIDNNLFAILLLHVQFGQMLKAKTTI